MKDEEVDLPEEEKLDGLLADIYALAKENRGGRLDEEKITSSSYPPPSSPSLPSKPSRKAIKHDKIKRKIGFF